MDKRTDRISAQGGQGRRTTGDRHGNRINTSQELGQTLILATMFLAVSAGFVGLVVDVGFVVQEKTHVQAGVDSAALAGASALPDEELATSLAADFAAKNGLTEPRVELTINTPYNGDPTKIEVIATTTQNAYFASVLGLDIFNVSARAVGTLPAASGGVQVAMLALNPTMCLSFDTSGSSTITVDNDGGIMVNSSCNPSLRAQGIGTVTAAAIKYYYPAGFEENGAQFTPTPTSVAQPVPDPLKDLPPPDLSSMAVSPDSGGTASNPATNTIQSGAATLNPGIYYGGLAVKSHANVTLNPGIYVMAGGGFRVQGSPAISGSEVMIYNTFDPEYQAGAGACDAIEITGAGTWNYAPPTSGTYEGIGLWQDKSCTNEVKLTSTSDGGPSGVIYVPTATVRMAGDGSLGSIQLIADSFVVAGGGDMYVDFVPYIDIPLQTGGVKLVE